MYCILMGLTFKNVEGVVRILMGLTHKQGSVAYAKFTTSAPLFPLGINKSNVTVKRVMALKIIHNLWLKCHHFAQRISFSNEELKIITASVTVRYRHFDTMT